ncbi:MAG TPA: PEP-CTERM sorting domain-containing protein [Nitrospiraceae bacterium]|jgi:hypothetical protein|nr:PEP-CTERM sorting domain-containing protein [Nitrospiraceae bacterium]
MRLFLCALATLFSLAASMPAHTRPITVLGNGPILTNGITKQHDSLDLTGLTGLDRANQVAGEHGQQGRDNAAFHHAAGSAQHGSFTTLDSPTTVPGGNPSSVPEPTSLLLLSSGLVGLWFARLRKS